MNKRGLSPIVATVLLIAFAVALGAMIMSWTTGIAKEAPSCKDIPTEIINADNFCKMADKVIQRVKVDQGPKKYEVCSDHSLTLSQLSVC